MRNDKSRIEQARLTETTGDPVDGGVLNVGRGSRPDGGKGGEPNHLLTAGGELVDDTGNGLAIGGGTGELGEAGGGSGVGNPGTSLPVTLGGKTSIGLEVGGRELGDIAEGDQLVVVVGEDGLGACDYRLRSARHTSKDTGNAKPQTNKLTELGDGVGGDTDKADAKVDLVLVDGIPLVYGKRATVVATTLVVGELSGGDDTAVVTAVNGRVERGEGGTGLRNDEALGLDTVGQEAGGSVVNLGLVTADDENGTGDGLDARVGNSRLEGEERAHGAGEEAHIGRGSFVSFGFLPLTADD